MSYPASVERPVGLKSSADLPEAFGQLAHLVFDADEMGPRTAGWLAGGHARSLACLAEVLERRDRVPGATAPVRIGSGGELRMLGVKQIVIRSEARAWRSQGRNDTGPRRQMNKILNFFHMHGGRLSRSPTDEDLHAAVAALKPALMFAPALNHVVTRHVHGQQWRVVDAPGPLAQQYLLSASQEAQNSAVKLAVWLPDPAPRRIRPPATGRRLDPPNWGISR